MSDSIRVKVRCFSHIRHALGRDECELDLPAGSTTADAEAKIREMVGPAIAGLPLKVARNKSIVQEPESLEPGDELALLPPMQGG